MNARSPPSDAKTGRGTGPPPRPPAGQAVRMSAGLEMVKGRQDGAHLLFLLAIDRNLDPDTDLQGNPRDRSKLETGGDVPDIQPVFLAALDMLAKAYSKCSTDFRLI